MAEASPKDFKVRDEGGPLMIEKVTLNRVFEADHAGKTSIHVWITAEVTPADDTFQSLTADVAFVLLHNDEELGTCLGEAVSFETKESHTVKADNGLRIDINADVTGIVAKIDTVRTVHEAKEQRFDPA